MDRSDAGGAITDMGCPDGCYGYELVANLDFDTNGNGRVDAGDDCWNDGAGWEPMGSYNSSNSTITVFTGTFDGGNHTISNLYISRVGGRSDKITTGYYTGLFRGTGVGGTINRIRLVSVKVTGSIYVGGLVGSNDGTITASYATGRVTGSSNAGGLVGETSGGGITASYWDTQTTGQTSSAGSEDSAGKTTAQLQTPTSASGIYATWDPDVWDFGTSSQYPALKAEGLSVADQR